tara:strand:+ start:116 stop:499 length:384 start_codon:yes stop_codon:yes gene_type:complete
MQHQEFVCYKKNDKVMSLGMNLNNIVAKHYYSDKAIKGGGFRKNLNIPLPLMLLNHENSFLKETITDNNTQKGGGKKGGGKKDKDEVISDSLFEKLIDLKSKKNLKKTRKHKKGGRKKRKTKKLIIF